MSFFSKLHGTFRGYTACHTRGIPHKAPDPTDRIRTRDIGDNYCFSVATRVFCFSYTSTHTEPLQLAAIWSKTTLLRRTTHSCRRRPGSLQFLLAILLATRAGIAQRRHMRLIELMAEGVSHLCFHWHHSAPLKLSLQLILYATEFDFPRSAAAIHLLYHIRQCRKRA